MAGLLRTLGRICLASIFVSAGIDQARNPAGRAKKAAQEIPDLPEPELTARALGATMAMAGTTLALGVMPGRSAAVLALTLIPTTYVGHPFWKEEDPPARRGQITHFLKNLGMFGGLLVVTAEELNRRRN